MYNTYIDDKYRKQAIDIVNKHFGSDHIIGWNKLVESIAKALRESSGD